VSSRRIFGLAAAACAACCIGPILGVLDAVAALGLVSSLLIGAAGLVIAAAAAAAFIAVRRRRAKGGHMAAVPVAASSATSSPPKAARTPRTNSTSTRRVLDQPPARRGVDRRVLHLRRRRPQRLMAGVLQRVAESTRASGVHGGQADPVDPDHGRSRGTDGHGPHATGVHCVIAAGTNTATVPGTTTNSRLPEMSAVRAPPSLPRRILARVVLTPSPDRTTFPDHAQCETRRG
jgi:hypothetical protein